MKKILWSAGAYFVTALAQLVCIIAFLVSQMDALKKGIVLSALLLLSAAALLVFDRIVKREERAGRVDERLACIIYLGQKQVSLLLSMAVVNLVVILISAFWNVSIAVTSAAAICYVLACMIAIVQLFRITRSEEKPEPEDQDEPEDLTELENLAEPENHAFPEPAPEMGEELFQAAGDLDGFPGENGEEQ